MFLYLSYMGFGLAGSVRLEDGTQQGAVICCHWLGVLLPHCQIGHAPFGSRSAFPVQLLDAPLKQLGASALTSLVKVRGRRDIQK